jgi:hypothetical protein
MTSSQAGDPQSTLSEVRDMRETSALLVPSPRLYFRELRRQLFDRPSGPIDPRRPRRTASCRRLRARAMLARNG